MLLSPIYRPVLAASKMNLKNDGFDQLGLDLSSDPQSYHYLRQDEKTAAGVVEGDRVNYRTTVAAFRTLGFSNDMKNALLKIVAAVLHLIQTSASSQKQLNLVAKLLELDSHAVITALTERVIAVKGEVMQKTHTLMQAEYGRDALAKAIYDRMFTWIVSKINDIIDVRDSRSRRTVIGVLDIYGFEVFDANSFEQLCINYCNEKLQQLFIELVLKQEQEEYKREGIAWQNVEFFNNQIICELVEKPHQGVFAILDDACLNVGKVTDELLLEAMDKELANHEHYTSRQIKPLDKTLKHKTQFRIRHYAGDVIYDIKGFLDKNRDTLFQDFKRLLFNSRNDVIRLMWPEGAQDITKTTKRPQTAGTLFKNSMIALVKTLASKEPFYVRCIKPNEEKSPCLMDDERVEHQVRYLGLLENIRVRRAGFAHRQRYDRFLKRYKMISQFTWPNFRNGSDEDAVRHLIEEKGFSADVKYGHTKIFIRNPNTLFSLEAMRAELIDGIVILIQKQMRGLLCRLRYRKMKAALAIIQHYRTYKIKSYITKLSLTFRPAKRMRDYGKSRVGPHPPLPFIFFFFFFFFFVSTSTSFFSSLLFFFFSF
ncbi:hypothetical protein LSTR_LSTR007126 [Laodelphax striatellus]|uniref:Myosin motor domain-containing protein n=1 Tax=Laodelphax striatellus TaxID=195883 RepID=A0A482XH78_LAOST|nr:hypothetical protein LSTR_LSTR007126 [Laodelphax striatellus]